MITDTCTCGHPRYMHTIDLKGHLTKCMGCKCKKFTKVPKVKGK